MNLEEGCDAHALSAALMKAGAVGVSVNTDLQNQVGNMMDSLDYVVLLVIACAAALAFIVLYNLTNINITERMREIATIKVLGFTRRETGSYVFRENMVLAVLGAGVGIPLGILLHRFVMAQIQIDMISFYVHIAPESFLLGVALTFVFACFVNFVLQFKLDRIDMAESLKSIE